MALPDSWTDEIFTRLAVRYGAKLPGAYPNVAIEHVKIDWGEVLDGTGIDSIRYALVNLPVDWPPTATQFRELCRAAPQRRTLALPEPLANPQLRAAALEKIRSLKIGDGDPRAWIGRLLERQRAGEKLTEFQRQCLANALENLGIQTATETKEEDTAARLRTAALQEATQRQVKTYLLTNPDATRAWSKEQRDAHQRALDSSR